MGDDYKYEIVRRVDDPVIRENKLKTYLIVPQVSASDLKRKSVDPGGKHVTINPEIVSTYEGQRATLPGRRGSIAGTANKVSCRSSI